MAAPTAEPVSVARSLRHRTDRCPGADTRRQPPRLPDDEQGRLGDLHDQPRRHRRRRGSPARFSTTCSPSSCHPIGSSPPSANPGTAARGLYDLPTMTRTRLFHNNSVRTIAPEYSWQPTPDGTRVLITAERDGDTVTPDRGVYLVDLTRKVTRDELRARVRTQPRTRTRPAQPGRADVRSRSPTRSPRSPRRRRSIASTGTRSHSSTSIRSS